MHTPHLSFAVTLAAGCASASVPSPPEAAIVNKGGRCSPQVCGTHSAALMECSLWWELNSDGLPNDNGARIVSVHRADGTPMKLTAELDHLRGIDPVSHALLADHLELTDTVIVVVVGSITHTLQITRVALADQHFWVGTQDPIESYDITDTPVGGAGVSSSVIAFTGDRYGPVDKLVSVGLTTVGWINFACVTGMVYRMHALGHTTAAQIRLGIATTLSKCQSTLYALTMTPCGTGTSFTTLVEPITLSESQHLLPPTSPLQVAPASYEAIWGPTGAVCLNVPRLANNLAQLDDMIDGITAECGAPLPACSSAQLASFDHSGDVLTGNPPGSSP